MARRPQPLMVLLMRAVPVFPLMTSRTLISVRTLRSCLLRTRRLTLPKQPSHLIVTSETVNQHCRRR
jgi:hypothetical protein